ncbi:MAG: PTS galactitol transporter subunit IIC [Anaerolineae bacterium]|nr:PTS galactitol transporter subunit IIC [Anaerolineae bacterium]
MQDTLRSIIDFVLGLGPAVFVGLIIFLIGLLVRAKPGRALSAGITLGVAFSGVGLVIGYLIGGVAPSGQAFIENTGVELTSLDFGWTAGAAITWAIVEIAVFMFVLQIGINLVMLALNWTRCLNVDMWNVWGKIFMAALVREMTGNTWVPWVLAAIWIVLELKSADLTENQVQHYTGIPGVSVPHLILLDNIILTPVAQLLESIPWFRNVKTDPQGLRDRIGIFGENHVIGFILGFLLAFIGAMGDGIQGSEWNGILGVAFVGATGLTLMPKVAALFMEALAPIQEAAAEFMKARFPGRSFSIGLDWPVLAGLPSLWTAAILLIPVLLLFAVILPDNSVLPFGSILLIESTIGTVILARNELVKTWIYAVLISITRFYTATVFAGAITTLSQMTGTFVAPEGFETYTWLGMSYMNWVMLKVGQLFQGEDVLIGIIVIAVMVVTGYMWWNEMQKREAELAPSGMGM